MNDINSYKFICVQSSRTCTEAMNRNPTLPPLPCLVTAKWCVDVSAGVARPMAMGVKGSGFCR